MLASTVHQHGQEMFFTRPPENHLTALQQKVPTSNTVSMEFNTENCIYFFLQITAVALQQRDFALTPAISKITGKLQETLQE